MGVGGDEGRVVSQLGDVGDLFAELEEFLVFVCGAEQCVAVACAASVYHC